MELLGLSRASLEAPRRLMWPAFVAYERGTMRESVSLLPRWRRSSRSRSGARGAGVNLIAGSSVAADAACS